MPGSYEDNVFFIGEFDDSLERDVILPLTHEIGRQEKLKDGRIDLYITSPGGYLHLVDHLVNLIEVAKRQGTIVRTIVPSIAFSAGSMLAIAGSPGERYIAKGAEHLIHYGQIMSFETTPEQIKRFTEHKERLFKRNFEHYQKYSSVPDLSRKMMDDAYFVPAPKAIKFKLADKYMEKMDILD